MDVPRPVWALAAVFVWSASAAALLWVLPRWDAPRPGVSLAVLTLSGAVVGLAPFTVVRSGTPEGMALLAGALLAVLVISGCTAVALAASRVAHPWWVVALVGALFLPYAGIAHLAAPRDRPRDVSRLEADYTTYPHGIVVVGATDDWHPFEAHVHESEFTITYRGPSDVHVVVRSGPETSGLGGGPDPLRSVCDDIDSLCEESADGAYVLPLNGPSPHARGTHPTDRIRTEAAPGLLVEVILGRQDEIRPEPDVLVKNVQALELRLAEPEDLNAIARGVYEWNRPRPRFD